MQIILGLVVLIVILGIVSVLLRLLFKVVMALFKGAGIVLAFALVAPFLPAWLLARGTQTVTRRTRCFGVLSVAMGFAVVAMEGQHLLSLIGNFNPITYAVAAGTAVFALLVILAAYQLHRVKGLVHYGLTPAFFQKKSEHAQALLFAGATNFAVGMILPPWLLQSGMSPPEALWGQAVYFLVAIGLEGYACLDLGATTKATIRLSGTLRANRTTDAAGLIQVVEKDSFLDKTEVGDLFDTIASKMVVEGHQQELDLSGRRWFFQREWYAQTLLAIDEDFQTDVKHSPGAVSLITSKHLKLPKAANDDFIDRHLDVGAQYHFAEGRFFVSHRRADEINVCASCGQAEVKTNTGDSEENWYCSKICQKTEKLCEALEKTSRADFLAQAAAYATPMTASADAWIKNHKVVAAGGQGHGFAAEKANHLIDRIRGRSAVVVGDNNAKHGADRLVDGHYIQTKYCKTAGKSVGQGFGADGYYKYRGSDGTPMQLEVPSDQYAKARELLIKKMELGKVLGRDEKPMPPERVDEVLRKGRVSYKQAVAITRFGRIQSLAYDAAEGAVIGLTAGGISFGISGFLHYINTGDRNAALRAASVQAGKSFGMTMLVYVGTQQLHRLETVQATLKLIDFSASSPTTLRLLQSGLGIEASSAEGAVNAINKSVRGTVVASAVILVVMTGPELIKLIRGRISRAQFMKNVAIGASGVIGGTVGGFVGGVLGAPLGPYGVIAGRFAGGVVGGMFAAKIASVVADELMEDDRVAMLAIVSEQLEYLARLFVLSAEELDVLNANLDQVVTASMLEALYGEKVNRKALANHYLKPTVVGVVKQRPPFEFEAKDVVFALEAMAA